MPGLVFDFDSDGDQAVVTVTPSAISPNGNIDPADLSGWTACESEAHRWWGLRVDDEQPLGFGHARRSPHRPRRRSGGVGADKREADALPTGDRPAGYRQRECECKRTRARYSS